MQHEQAGRHHTEADGLIQAMYRGDVGWAARERARERKLGATFATVRADPGASAALHRLVYGLQGGSRLVAIDPVLQSPGPPAGNTGLDALLHFARFQDQWLKEPETWEPDRPAVS